LEVQNFVQVMVYRDWDNIQREEAQTGMITIDYKDRRPLYQQLMEKIEELALGGLIKADEQLPSVRSLAVELAINPNTIQRAYGELEKKGIVYSVPGRGSFLAASQEALLSQSREVIWRDLLKLIERAKNCGVDRELFLAEAAKLYEKGDEDSDNNTKYQQAL